MKRSLFLLSAAGMLALASCSKNESSPGQMQSNAKVQLMLTDAPGDYSKVFVSIKEVRINVGDVEAENVPEGSSNGKWVSYPLAPAFTQPVDLLDLRNNDWMYIGEPLSLPAGKISQIRLILNETGNTVVLKDGTVHELTTPSAQQSGLKINFHQTLVPDGIYRILLDFDADKSVVKAGNSGKYILKPVIKAKTEAATFGAVSGFVLPTQANTSVYLIRAASPMPDTVARTAPELPGSPLGEGFFKFGMVDPGTYYISLNAADESYQDVTIQNVVVTSGQIKNLGTSTLHK